MIGLLLVVALACPDGRPATEGALAAQVTCLEREERAALDAAAQAARRQPLGEGIAPGWVFQQTTFFGSLWSFVKPAAAPSLAALDARLGALDEALAARFADGRARLQRVLPLDADHLSLPTLTPAGRAGGRSVADSLLVNQGWLLEVIDFASLPAAAVGELWEWSRVWSRSADLTRLQAVAQDARVAAWIADRHRALRAAQAQRRRWVIEGLALADGGG